MTDTGDALGADEHALLDCLPTDGTSKGNRAVRHGLGWDEDRYFLVRNRLEDQGRVVRGRGQGGSVRRVVSTDASTVVTVSASPEASAYEVEATIRGEMDLYEPMRRVIAREWAKDHRVEPEAVEITAQQGRRSTGGTWSRPDITSVEVRTFGYVPGKFLEVVTFEVKPYNTINVQAVYEALAHRRSATRSYVLVHVPPEVATSYDEIIHDVASVARGHGVGLITAGDPEDYDTWEEREQAERFEPDPARLDEFIFSQLTDQAKSRILRRLR